MKKALIIVGCYAAIVLISYIIKMYKDNPYHERRTNTYEVTTTSYVRQTCVYQNCSNKKTSGSAYCSKHTCQANNCTSFTDASQKYCSKHSNKEDKTTQQASQPTSQPESKAAVSSKKQEMPDCDDYESLEDFLVDWEGNMPDGSDAMDYWDEW